MPTAIGGALQRSPQTELVSDEISSENLVKSISEWLDDAKAEDVLIIELAGKTSVADYMVVASGRSDRHVGAIAEQLQRNLKDLGHGRVHMEGKENCDWVLLDTGDIIVHIFRPEVRDFYNLEKMWQADRPPEETTSH
ncbi:MAG TPA: ribosome silencing factor [Hyphomicrobiaceae bacterium]|nr:ribosome silencing factor [Hyphomicrobiaceae bacterium]